MAYMVSNTERPNNHPIYSLDTEMGLAIFFSQGREERFSRKNASFVPTQKHLDGLWNVTFDGAVCKEGAGGGVWVQLPRGGALN